TPTKAGHPTLVAVRGTVFSRIKPLLDDLDPKGIGLKELNDNLPLIKKTMQQAARNGRVVVAGFSLGAAVAQRVACELPSLVSRVVTFHAPGIEHSKVESLRSYNQANPGHTVKQAGETTGKAIEKATGKVGSALDHQH